MTFETKKGLRGALLAIVLALLAASCGGGDGDDSTGEGTPRRPQNLTRDSLPGISLQTADLPDGYALEAGYPKQFSTARECLDLDDPREAGALDQLQSFGLQGCYSATYTKKVGNFTNRPGSGSFLFQDADSASKALPVVRQLLVGSFSTTGAASQQSSTDVPVSGLGDEATPAAKISGTLLGRPFATVFYVWRASNAVILFGGTDAIRDMNEQAMLDIAKKLDSRARQ